jgi:2-succinyl-5-enolpyruvyl-6-hydroxy-3-cyclohexene-1-carboxylate synthase
MNIHWSQKIIEELHRHGVRDVVFCAGARNSPLVSVLSKTTGVVLHSFFEERSASFYALGLIRRTGRPVVVITTSGTAVAELLPAAVEAFHTGLPLLLLTADRPKRLRGTGAPQAIDQSSIFGIFAPVSFDLELGELFSLSEWNRRAPVHVNLCFDEPLIDKFVDELNLPEDLSSAQSLDCYFGQSVFLQTASAEWASLRLTKFLKSEGTLLVIVGTLESDEEKESVARFLKNLGAPVFLESTSGLRERADLRDLALISGDQVLSWALRKNLIARVLRVGGVPTVRIWRDLDEKESSIDVMSLSNLPFGGLSRGELVCAPISATLQSLTVQGQSALEYAVLFNKDREAAAHLESLFVHEPESEPAMFRRLSKLIPDSALVYMGNSLPIREWDLAASRNRVFHIEANRGVNGIDGQISTFLGLARPGVGNWAVIGDLTALYDLSGPWALRVREAGLEIRLVVINNGGGKIFNRIFKNDLFENRHDIEFENWAKMWKLGYQKWTSVPEAPLVNENVATVEVIEIQPDEAATKRFWDDYDRYWRS